jgi:hypothetical protein
MIPFVLTIAPPCDVVREVLGHICGRTTSASTTPYNRASIEFSQSETAHGFSRLHRQSSFDCTVRNGLDIPGFADNGSAKDQGVFVAYVFIEPRLTSGRDRAD